MEISVVLKLEPLTANGWSSPALARARRRFFCLAEKIQDGVDQGTTISRSIATPVDMRQPFRFEAPGMIAGLRTGGLLPQRSRVLLYQVVLWAAAKQQNFTVIRPITAIEHLLN